MGSALLYHAATAGWRLPYHHLMSQRSWLQQAMSRRYRVLQTYGQGPLSCHHAMPKAASFTSHLVCYMCFISRRQKTFVRLSAWRSLCQPSAAAGRSQHMFSLLPCAGLRRGVQLGDLEAEDFYLVEELASGQRHLVPPLLSDACSTPMDGARLIKWMSSCWWMSLV